MRLRLFNVLLLCPAIACGAVGQEEAQPQLAPGLVVVEGATAPTRIDEYDGAISYHVRDPFPGSIVIARLGERLAADGWKEMTLDFVVTPGAPAATRQWATSFDSSDRMVRDWSGSWENETGAVVVYFLRYESEQAARVAEDLQVRAIYFSPQRARQVREVMRRR